MFKEAFADAARPAPRCILRLPMRPYSIGHELILTQRRNPLVCLSETEFNTLPISQQIAAVINAALICYRTWDENHRRERNLWLWGWFIRRTDWPVAIMEFRIYRAEGSLAPRITESRFSDIPPSDDSVSRAFGSPFLARLIHFLSQRPLSIIQPPLNPVMDYPFGQAAFEYMAAGEEQGRVQVENESEHETRTSFEKHEADIRAEHAAERAAETEDNFCAADI